MQYSENLIKFLKDRDIQSALTKLDFEYIFDQLPPIISNAKLLSDLCRVFMKLKVPFLNYTEKIPGYLFAWHKKLTRIRVPDNIRIIENNAFYFCKNLKEVILPEGLEFIDKDAFTGCDSLEVLVIPKSIKGIHFDAFNGCNNLHLKIPSEVKDSLRNLGVLPRQVEFY